MSSKNEPASRDEYFIAVGKVVQNAILCESIMATSLKILLKSSFKTASAIFFTLDSFSSKKELLNRTVVVSGDSKDKEMIDDIIAAANKANNQRREVAHALILFKHPDRPTDFAIRRPKSGDKRIVTKGWLSNLMGQSFEAGKECFLAFQKLSQKHRVPATPEI